MRTIKTAVSLPFETYQKVEKLRKKINKSRSQMVSDALKKMLEEAETREVEQRYADAYKAMPETQEEIADVEAGLGEGWTKNEDWEAPDAAR